MEILYCSITNKIFEYWREDSFTNSIVKNTYFVFDGKKKTEVEPSYIYTLVNLKKSAIFLDT